MATEVRDVGERNRFEARVGGELAGFAQYRRSGERITFTHTQVDPSFEGQGVGSALAQQSLDDARRQGLAVVPLCSFIRSWIGRHPAYADLVADPPAGARPDGVSG